MYISTRVCVCLHASEYSFKWSQGTIQGPSDLRPNGAAKLARCVLLAYTEQILPEGASIWGQEAQEIWDFSNVFFPREEALGGICM